MRNAQRNAKRNGVKIKGEQRSTTDSPYTVHDKEKQKAKTTIKTMLIFDFPEKE